MAPEIAQFCQQRQQRQADDGEMIAVDLLEQLDALALDLVGADAGQRLVADAGQMAADEGRRSSLRMVRLRDADMAPEKSSPSRASTTALFNWCVLPDSDSRWRRASSMSRGL